MTREKIFGYDQAQVEKITTEYCAREIEHNTDYPIFSVPFWASVHSGCKKLVEQRKDLLNLV